ncbi:TPA: ADP-ribosylglycohydrolase family protein, partial [Klebsiella pneumoniae]|nr:ADP-ribosylglycohydrolase family protein [Klebsiella pneumoniae]
MNQDKIMGCLVGAAMGDAMGATTELRTIEQIQRDFSGWVTTFIKPPQDTFGRCNIAGQCTDDFIQGQFIMEEALKCQGVIDDKVMKAAFRRWLDYPFYLNFTGPTTRTAMQKLFNDQRMSLQGSVEPAQNKPGVTLINNGNSSSTNGAAMKIWVAVLLPHGNKQQLLENVYQVCRLTHDNVLSISGAAAIAFAIDAAMNATTISDIFTSAIEGAEKGYAYALEQGAMMMAGASVVERIKLAISIGSRYECWQDAVKPLSDI